MQHKTLALFLTFIVGCTIDPDTTDDLVSSEASASFAACPTGSWCIEPTPLTTTPSLAAVWAVSASDVFAVGEGGVILRRSPTAWTQMTSGTTRKLNGVWAASSSDVWAVGAGGTILRFNGTAWSSVTGVTTSDLSAVWGSSSTDVWLTSLGSVLHWNGSAFSTSAMFSGHLGAISGTGPSDVWVTGEITGVHHFTGSAWVTVNPGAGSTYAAVLAQAGGDVWVTDVTSNKESMHLSGGVWTAQKTNTVVFSGLAAFGVTDVWAGGTSTKIGHWNGTAWTITAPLGSLTQINSVTKTTGHVWVVGVGALVGHHPL
jgi:hypothetical protein